MFKTSIKSDFLKLAIFFHEIVSIFDVYFFKNSDKLAFRYAVYLFARLIDFANINVKIMMIFENTSPDTKILIYIS